MNGVGSIIQSLDAPFPFRINEIGQKEEENVRSLLQVNIRHRLIDKLHVFEFESQEWTKLQTNQSPHIISVLIKVIVFI